MKKNLRIISLLLVLFLCFSSAVMAEEIQERDTTKNSSANARVADTATIIAKLDNVFEESFDYHKVWYYQPLNCICIDIAVNGFAEVMPMMIEEKCDSEFEAWVQFKEGAMQMYNDLLDSFEQYGRDDLTLALAFVNDDIYIREDENKLSYMTFLEIRDNEVWFDLLFELEWMRYFED